MLERQPFASVDDVSVLMPLTYEQREIAATFLAWASDRLRLEAKKAGKDLDCMATDSVYASVLRAVTAGIVERTLKAVGDDANALMTQYSQSAGGYSVSGTFSNPGESMYIKRTELKALGLTGWRNVEAVEIYG